MPAGPWTWTPPPRPSSSGVRERSSGKELPLTLLDQVHREALAGRR
ncbi:hypothetical protein [Kitasatospora sp. NPDC050463]